MKKMGKNGEDRKLKIGWFSFTCCEDSTIVLTELLNTYFDTWKKIIEFRHFKILKQKNILSDLDVAFIEGAISSCKQEEEVKRIRENARYVVAVGSCACTGMPSASRNEFSGKEIDEKIAWYMSHFDYSSKVKKLEDVIKVDDSIPGCPMSEGAFLTVLKKYLRIFNIDISDNN